MKQYIGISRDHSGSMASLRQEAMQDYNTTIAALRDASDKNGIDTIVSVVTHQGRSAMKTEVINSSVNSLKPLSSYPTPGGDTPLFDSVLQLITILELTPDLNSPDVSFLVVAVTDGQDNSSLIKGGDLGRKIQKLQATDKWTFVFRVPFGYKQHLVNLGIPDGNVQEWEQTQKGFIEATEQTTRAINNFYTGRILGITASSTFYANASNISETRAAAKLEDISAEVAIFPVNSRTNILDFLSSRVGYYNPGTGFYQLSKTEKAVQKYKVIAIRNKNSGAVYAGQAARQMLGIPTDKTISLKPGDHGQWDIFIQSTSTNRILLPGTSVLYWRNA